MITLHYIGKMLPDYLQDGHIRPGESLVAISPNVGWKYGLSYQKEAYNDLVNTILDDPGTDEIPEQPSLDLLTREAIDSCLLVFGKLAYDLRPVDDNGEETDDESQTAEDGPLCYFYWSWEDSHVRDY